MTLVVTDPCIKCKYTTCVTVCPVDCFHEGETMLVIDPEVCIDCGICEPECPVDAIIPDSRPEAEPWLEINRHWSSRWPVILAQRAPHPDAEVFKSVAGKYPEHFEPGRSTSP